MRENTMCPMCYQDMDEKPRTSKLGKYCGWCGQSLDKPKEVKR